MLYYMFNKPMGCVTARSDAVHRTVMDYFPPQLAKKLHPVGRLDKDTCGLLILTDDGMLDVSIMQPKKHISKTYFFYAIGSVNDEKAALLENGVPLAGFTTDRAKFRLIKRFRIGELEAFMPEKRRMRYMKNPDGPAFAAELTISEGKKHEVKRMLEAVCCRIFYLRRECIEKLRLDPCLEQGQFRPLTVEEVAMLKSNAEI